MACFIMAGEFIGGGTYGGISPGLFLLKHCFLFLTCRCYVGHKCNELQNYIFIFQKIITLFLSFD